MEINPGLKRSFQIIGGLILFAAIAPLGLGIWTYSNTKSFLKTANQTTGVVVELVESSSGGTFAPRVRFRDLAGEQFEVTSSSSSSPPRYHAGEEIKLFYNPERPQEFRTDDWFSLWAGPVIGFGFVGFNVFFAAVVAFLGPVILQGIISAFRNPNHSGQSGEACDEKR